MPPEQLVQILSCDAPDHHFLRTVDGAIADAVARSGSWLACRPGCSQCCHGVFSISPLDAHRLVTGLDALTGSDPARAARVRKRVRISAERLLPEFPGDPLTGTLKDTPEAAVAFEDFANEEPCPVLDPETHTCDLYAHRPVLCRTFGPPLETEEAGLAICDLCFNGASPAEIKAAQIDPAIVRVEQAAVTAHAAATGRLIGDTIVTFALAGAPTVPHLTTGIQTA